MRSLIFMLICNWGFVTSSRGYINDAKLFVQILWSEVAVCYYPIFSAFVCVAACFDCFGSNEMVVVQRNVIVASRNINSYDEPKKVDSSYWRQ